MLLPIEQQYISQFAPIDIDPLFKTLGAKQARQNTVLEDMDALREFESTFQTVDADRDLFGEEIADIRAGLDELSNVGYVGNRGRQVRALAREAQRRALPFQQNLQNYNASRQAVENDATLSRDQKDARIAELDATARLQRDQTGNIDPNSVFKGRTFASAVDLSELANDAVQGAVAAETFNIRSSDDAIGIQSDRFIPRDKIRQIAETAIRQDPQAMAFIQDEIDLIDAQMQRSTGEGLTQEQRDQIFNNRIQSSVEGAVAKYGQVQSSIKIQSAGGSGKKKSDPNKEVGLPFSTPNTPVAKRSLADRRGNVRSLGTQIEALQKELQNPTLLTGEREALELQIRDLNDAIRLEEEDIRAAKLAVAGGDPQRLAEMDAELEELQESISEIEVPEGLDPLRAQELRNLALKGQLVGDGRSQVRMGAPGQFVASITPKSPESEYRNRLVEFQSGLNEHQRGINTAISRQLEMADNKRRSDNLEGRSFTPDSDIKPVFEQVIQNTALDVGIEIYNEDWERVQDIDPSKIEVAGYTLSPDAENHYYLTGRDENGGSIQIRMSPEQAGDLGRRLEDSIGTPADNAQLEVYLAAKNMQGKGYADDFRNMSPGATREVIPGLPEDFLFIEGDQTQLKKLPNGMFQLLNSAGEEIQGPDGRALIFRNEEELSLRLIAPIAKARNASTE